MGVFRRALAVTGWGSLGTALAFTVYTRKSRMVDMSDMDYLLGTTLFARYNPNNNPVLKDICVRKVPIKQIRPELVEQDGKLVEAFCAGFFSGWAYTIQRRILERKYRGPETSSQLWDVKDIQQSQYELGTAVTDHFEVVSKTPNSIILRCGDTPRNNAVRESDGLFEMTAEVNKAEGTAEFQLKAAFYNGAGVPQDGKPVETEGPVIQWLHQKYDKMLMEDAVRNCTN